MLNAWLHFTNNDFRTPTSIEEILDQPLFLNSHTKLDFSSNNPYFYLCVLWMVPQEMYENSSECISEWQYCKIVEMQILQIDLNY